MTPDPSIPGVRVQIAIDRGVDPSTDLTDIEHDAECLEATQRDQNNQRAKTAIEEMGNED